MKKFLVFSLVLLSQISQARSILPSILEYSNGAHPSLAGGMSEQLNVYANGQVVLRKRQAVFPPHPSKEVARLTSYQVDRLNRLIEAAAKGKYKTIPGSALCGIAPHGEYVYTANMGQLLLRKGHPCSQFKINTSPAAVKLVEFLDRLVNKAHNKGFISENEVELLGLN